MSAKRVPKMVRTAPERIYLIVDCCDREEHLRLPFPKNHDDIAWCDDEIGAAVEYVRADLVQP